jgi:LysM repeat protein
MKILKIFGIVVAVHAAAFIFVFATPGCRSTKRRSHSAAQTVPPPAEHTVSFPGAAAASPVASESQTVAAPAYNADLNPGVAPADGTIAFDAANTTTPTVRFNPTRPKTPVAEALQTAPVRDVTPASAYTVAKGDSLWTIAKKHGLNVNELAVANNLKASTPVKIGQKLIIPTKAVQPTSTTASTGIGASAQTLNYKVQPGETLSQIARKAGTTAAVIKSLNKLSSENLRAGQDLVLPAGPSSAAALAATPDSESAKSKTRTSSTGSRPYTVKSGETLGQIARKHGVTQRELAILNHISDPLKLRAGQVIQIPNAEPAPEATLPAPVQPVESSPISPISPISSASESSPVAPAAEVAPPIIRVDEGSPVEAPRN